MCGYLVAPSGISLTVVTAGSAVRGPVRGRSCFGLASRLRCGGFVLLNNARRDAAALADRDALVFRPRPDVAAALTARCGTRRPAALSASGLSGMFDVGRDLPAEPAGILLAEVDLVFRAAVRRRAGTALGPKCCRLTAAGAEQPTSRPGLYCGPSAGTVAVGRAYQMLIWERHRYLLRLRIALGGFFPAAEGTSLSTGEVLVLVRLPAPRRSDDASLARATAVSDTVGSLGS
jgi:hypothetical protein